MLRFVWVFGSVTFPCRWTSHQTIHNRCNNRLYGGVYNFFFVSWKKVAASKYIVAHSDDGVMEKNCRLRCRKIVLSDGFAIAIGFIFAVIILR